MKISIFIKLESQIVTCLEVPISQAYPISCAIARNCFGSLLGGNKLDFPHLMQPRDPRMNHNAYFSLLMRIKQLLLVIFFDRTARIGTSFWTHA